MECTYRPNLKHYLYRTYIPTEIGFSKKKKDISLCCLFKWHIKPMYVGPGVGSFKLL